MPHYLSPRNDYVFRLIFVEHKHLCISLLNSLLPLEEPNRIVSIEYLLPEHVPRTPLGKNSIADVKCTDASGRFFVVEMLFYWSSLFTKQMIFDKAQVLIEQAGRTVPDEPSRTFSSLQPVYTLAIVNQYFQYKDEDRWMYAYQVACMENPSRALEGLNLIVVDLETEDLVRKIHAQQGWAAEKKRMAALWLRFLKETTYYGALDRELSEDDTIRMAAKICEEGDFTRNEMEIYDCCWDHVRVELDLAKRDEKQRKAPEADDNPVRAKIRIIEDRDKPLEDRIEAFKERERLLDESVGKRR
ncbi:MAG: Rpn family recombination-promoting nuclease/putative transposase [Bacteroidales bacterium]|jgi:hypothetical protein|nr:Rpn family recombination-promoting nuclease/putative transposase [Bacteroidales bacterium]